MSIRLKKTVSDVVKKEKRSISLHCIFLLLSRPSSPVDALSLLARRVTKFVELREFHVESVLKRLLKV